MSDASRIVRYVRDQLSAGYPEQQIRDALAREGWHPEEIGEAISLAKASVQKHGPPKPAPGPSVKKEHPERHAERAPGQHHEKPAKKHMGRIGFLLALAGGFLIALNSVLVFAEAGDMLGLVLPGISISFLEMSGVAISAFDSLLINIMIGAFLIGASFITRIMPDRAGLTGMFTVALSVIAVLVGNGFLIGGTMAMVGGVLLMLER